MRIGMSLTSSYARQDDSKQVMDDLIARVELMAELSFDSLSLGDHHVTRNHYLQVMPTMCRMSAHSGDMQLIPLFLLPFYHPILLAEQIAVLDVMSGGRTRMICCLGHQPEAHLAFQTPQNVRVSRFIETFEIVRQLCAKDDVTYQGKHYAFEGVTISPKPLQQPLPMWIGCNADPAIRRTARLADAWVISPGSTPALVEDKLRFYRDALQAHGREDQISEVVMRRDIHLSSSRQQARREASQLLDRGYRGFDAEAMEASLIGDDPEGCIRYLEGMQRMGITDILFRCARRDQSAALQTIRLIGAEVIPHFKLN